MSETAESSLIPALKLEELPIDEKNPWKNDALDRSKIAQSLTNLITGEQGPFVLSLSGAWGTGKTFLLKRWQKQLELAGFQAIYYNAWEDDYCDDPLLAIIGQLWETLKGGKLKELGEKIKDAAKPLLVRTISNAVRLGTVGLLDLDPKELKSVGEHVFEDYMKVRQHREELRERLSELASKIVKDTGKPLVFIIDELDRCRPTFAIELLERTKHIFDVQNIIFVFGMDRKQLSASIKSVYGSIDVDGYLRRFFDMDFQLPDANAQKFCEHLMERHKLRAYFEGRSETSKAPVHDQEYGQFREFFHKLCAHFELSLRDIEHSVRSFVIVGKNIEDRHKMFPDLLAILILLRIKDHDLYIRYTKQRCPASKVLDFLHDFLEIERGSSGWDRDWFDSMIYLTDYEQDSRRDIVAEQIELLGRGEEKLTHPEQLSKRTRALPKEEIGEFLTVYSKAKSETGRHGHLPTKEIITYLSGKLELASLVTESH